MLDEEIKKLPLSKLIYYMVFPGVVGETLDVDELEAYLRSNRLGSIYKSDPVMVEKFIKREKNNIEKRGYDLNKYTFNYSFSETSLEDEILRIIYENLELEDIDYIEKNTLTFSENLQLNLKFVYLKKLYQERIDKLKQERGAVPLSTINEYDMLMYYTRLERRLYNKLLDFIYKRADNPVKIFKMISFMFKEQNLLFADEIKKNPICFNFNPLYLDLSYDVALRDVERVKQYNREFNPKRYNHD